MPYQMDRLVMLGIIIIFFGFVILFLGLLSGARETSSKTNVAIGGFIGPIPFGIGNDKNFVWFVMVLSLVIFFFWLFFSLRFARS